jgi:hypothetical protein
MQEKWGWGAALVLGEESPRGGGIRAPRLWVAEPTNGVGLLVQHPLASYSISSCLYLLVQHPLASYSVSDENLSAV